MASPGNDSPSWARLALRVGYFSLRHRIWRRKLMLYVTLLAALQVAIGALILDRLLQSALLYLGYWSFCGFLVILMLLLAMYDMLAVRQEQRMELKRLREQMIAEQQEQLSDADDSGDPGKT